MNNNSIQFSKDEISNFISDSFEFTNFNTMENIHITKNSIFLLTKKQIHSYTDNNNTNNKWIIEAFKYPIEQENDLNDYLFESFIDSKTLLPINRLNNYIYKKNLQEINNPAIYFYLNNIHSSDITNNKYLFIKDFLNLAIERYIKYNSNKDFPYFLNNLIFIIVEKEESNLVNSLINKIGINSVTFPTIRIHFNSDTTNEEIMNYVYNNNITNTTKASLEYFIENFYQRKLHSQVKSEEELCEEDQKDRVIKKIVGTNYNKMVTNNDSKNIIVYYRTYLCNHCNKFFPILEEFAVLFNKNYPSLIEFFEIDTILNKINTNISKFPTIRLFLASEIKEEKEEDKEFNSNSKRIEFDFTGNFNLKEIIDFIITNIGDKYSIDNSIIEDEMFKDRIQEIIERMEKENEQLNIIDTSHTNSSLNNKPDL